MKTIVIILSSVFITTSLLSQDLRDELVGEYIGHYIERRASGRIDTFSHNWTYYFYKSPISDSLHMKTDLNDKNLRGRFVIHQDTSFSNGYYNSGKPFHISSAHGYKLSPDSIFYSEYMSGGAGGGEPMTFEFYGKKTNWIGIDENKQELEISLYPNPFNQELNIKSTQEIKQVLVRNLEGKSQLSLSLKQKAFKLPLSQLNNGVYFIELHTGNGIVLKKVLKK